jgi:hypothetical protein
MDVDVSTELATELVVEHLIATEAIGPGGIDPRKVLQLIHWPLAGTDEPQRMTAAEANAVIEFGAAVIAGREIWPTDPIGAGLKLAAWEHEWRPLPEPDKWGHPDEENAIEDAVAETMYQRTAEAGLLRPIPEPTP